MKRQVSIWLIALLIANAGCAEVYPSEFGVNRKHVKRSGAGANEFRQDGKRREYPKGYKFKKRENKIIAL